MFFMCFWTTAAEHGPLFKWKLTSCEKREMWAVTVIMWVLVCIIVREGIFLNMLAFLVGVEVPNSYQEKLRDTFSFIDVTKTCNLFNTPSCLTHINTIILRSVFISVQLIIPILKDMFLKQSSWSMICLYQGSVVKLVHHIYSSYSKQTSHIQIYNHTSQWWMPILLFNYFIACWYSLRWPVYTNKLAHYR